jgi:aryl-alcohol dehydrogenase-like predicted oxidoreductase
MWGGNDDRDAIQALEASIDLGITTIDTAPVYGFGHSEQLVGQVLKTKPRDQIQILTKYGLRWDTDKGVFHFASQMNDGKAVNIYKYASSESIIKEVEQSLKRLGTDYIDLYQIHWPDDSTPIDETMEAVSRLIESGKILAAGVCNYNADQLATADGTISIASNQVPYSMVHRHIEKDVVPYALDHGTSILAYSPLQRGLLTGKITPDYPFQPGDHRQNTIYFKEPNLSRINQLLNTIRPIAAHHQASLAQLVLNWTLSQPGITAVLAGARNAEQVQHNARSLEFTISPVEMAQISQLLDQLIIENA